MSNLERNGARLHCEEAGVGPPVLFTHGFAATSRIWRGQNFALAAQITIITWDMRGHGRSRVLRISARGLGPDSSPNAESVSIPIAGHAANLHQPKLFSVAARHFLDRVE